MKPKKSDKRRHCAKCSRSIAERNKSGLCTYHYMQKKYQDKKIKSLILKYKDLENAEIRSNIIEKLGVVISFDLINEVLKRKPKVTHRVRPMKTRDKLKIFERLEGNPYGD
jgi:hypothetical protein